MATYPTRRQLLLQDYQNQVRSDEATHREHLELMDALGKLHDSIQTQEVEREAERVEHRHQMEEMMKASEADKKALRQSLCQ